MNRCKLLVLSLLVLVGALKLSAQGTAFNYQGRLGDTGAPANGSYDFRFAVFNAVSNGIQISVPLTNSAVAVSNGLFNVTLDFGAGIFTGTNCWLELAVRAVSAPGFTVLTPRQPILPVPYAIFATTASNVAGTVSATQLTGTLPSAQISGTYANPVNFTNGANAFSGTFSGNGAALNSLNASQLTSGTVADARLSANVALLNGNQTFSGANNFTNTGNRFTGSFFGNGNVGWDAFPGPALQADFNHGYLLTNSQFTTVILPPTPPASDSTNIGYIVRISGAGPGGWQTAQATNQFIIGNFLGYRNSVWVPATTANTWTCLGASADGSIVYAGKASTGGIFGSTDFGHTWSAIGNLSGGSWTGLAASADGIKAFAVATSLNIQRTTNSGTSFQAVGPGTGSWVAVACSANSSNTLAATSGATGTLALSTNGGASGSWNATGPANFNWSDVVVSADGTRLAACINGKSIYVSPCPNINWVSNAPFAPWTALAISADGTRLAAAATGNSIYTSANGGASWSKSGAPTNNWTCLAASADCSRLFAGTSSGVVYASVNFGVTWSALNTLAGQNWSAIVGAVDGSRLVAAVNNNATGNLYYSSSSDQFTTLTSTNGVITGSQRSAVELQYIGSGQFMPVSSAGTIWAN